MPLQQRPDGNATSSRQSPAVHFLEPRVAITI
jgi:hypothetical protein